MSEHVPATSLYNRIWIGREWCSLEEPDADERAQFNPKLWKRTTYAWAKQHPEETAWLAPICRACEDSVGEITCCVGYNPHEECMSEWNIKLPECNRMATPYRLAHQ